MTKGNLFLQISRQYCYSVWRKLCFIWNVYFQFYHWKKQRCVLFFLYMTKIDLFSLSVFILFFLFCIPGTCIFYNSWKKIHSWSNNQLSCGILRKIFTMRAGGYERIINYDWPNCIYWKNEENCIKLHLMKKIVTGMYGFYFL